MGGENINSDNGVVGSEHAEWQNLGHKIAEQIASHTTTDKNGEAVYFGRELSTKAKGSVEESGFEKPGEEPRGTSKDGTISADVYPKQPGELDWQFRNRVNRMQDETDSATVKQIKERAQQILNNDAISNVYNHLLEQGTIHDSDLSDKQKNLVINEARELSLKTINHYYKKMLPNNNKHKLYVGEAYEKIYTDKIINDDSTPQVAKKELEDVSIDQAILDARQDGFNERWFFEEKKPSWKYQRDSARVANGVLQEYTHDVFSGLFDDDLELSKDETKKRQRAVIKTTIRSGLFMPNTTIENPEKADAILAENGIDKNSAQITAYAVDGVNEVDGNRKKEIADYFDLNNKISSMMDDPNFTFKYKNKGQDELRVKYDVPYYKRDYSLNDWVTERVLDPETTHIALDRLKDASSQIKDSVNVNPEYIERVKRRVRNYSENNMVNRVLTTQNSFDFGNLLSQLDVKKIDCGSEIIDHFIAERNDSEPFSRILTDYMNANGLDNPNLEVDVDYQKAIQDGLIMRLAQGVTKNGNRDIFLTRIFETQEYEDNKKKIGLDFTDEAIIPFAFNGFINTIKTTNGEYSTEANWYYDSIFSKNPDIFYSTVEAFRKTSKDIGAKRKLTNFGSKDGNETYYTYLNTLDENPELENQRVIKKSRLVNTNKQGLLHAVEVYKRRMYNKFLQTNPSLPKNNQNTKNGVNVNSPGRHFPNLGVIQKDNPPFDYGLQKAAAFFKYLDFVDENIPNSNVKTFELIFGDKAVGAGNSNHYMGFSFNYEGKRCAIAESLHPTASTYLIDSSIEEYEVSPEDEIEPFLQDLSGKTKTEVSKDPNVASVIHFGRKRFDESLDTDYQKGFMFFRTGNKDSVKYGWAGNRQSWERLHNQQFPAWPMLFDNGTQMDDLAGYQEWQEQQMQNQDNLIDEKLRMWNRKR